MTWRRIHFKCDPQHPGHEIGTAWLSDAGCTMFEETNEGVSAYGKEDELDAALVEITKKDMSGLGLVHWQESDVEQENWNAQWESEYAEVHIGNRIRIRAPFHEEASALKFDHTMAIQPRMAFGTGHHGTTSGLLAQMVDMDWENLSVLDMGCGSGVLGIHSAMCGASYVLCVDIDPWSVNNTKENAGLNGVKEDGNFEVREGGAQVLGSRDQGRFDVVIANINRNVLLADMGVYCSVLKPVGLLMLSGFMEPDVDPLVEAASAFGLKQMDLRAEGEWRILTLQR